jgi:hypothetical protein
MRPGLGMIKECRGGSLFRYSKQPVPVDGCLRAAFPLDYFVSLTFLFRESQIRSGPTYRQTQMAFRH